MNTQQFNAFLSDSRLVDLIELVKTSDDVMDVIDLSETQHSSMLAWCLRPNEGHAQGDAVIKDFLVAAFNAGSGSNKGRNATFFRKWHPSRIRTSSFGSAFIAREYPVGPGLSGSQRGRLDLFLIDATNEIIVVIENKTGSRLTGKQLKKYQADVLSGFSSHAIFKKYDFAFVVLDSYGVEYSQKRIVEIGNEWALLDYSWLKDAANRARYHVERNNHAATLLMAYCQKQSDWESDEDRAAVRIAASLTSAYEEVVEQINCRRFSEPASWVEKDQKEPTQSLLLFIQQNPDLCDLLLEMRGTAQVHGALLTGNYNLDEDQVEHHKSYVAIATEDMQALGNQNGDYWPLFISIFVDQTDSSGQTKFSVKIIWSEKHLRKDNLMSNAVRDSLVSNYPGLAMGKAQSRKQIMKTGLSAPDAVKLAVRCAKKLDEILSH